MRGVIQPTLSNLINHMEEHIEGKKFKIGHAICLLPSDY